MLRFIALRGVRAHMRTWNSHKTGKTLYIGIEAVLSFITCGKQTNHAKQFGDSTQGHMYSLYIGSLCNIAFPMARFTCIVNSQVLVKSECHEA